MLTRTGLGNNALFAHTQRQKALAEAVIDLVGAGVVQIFTLKINLCTAPVPREASGKVERCWPARVVTKKIVELSVKLGIALDGLVRGFQLLQGMHERFGHELPTVASEMTFHESPIIPTSAR